MSSNTALARSGLQMCAIDSSTLTYEQTALSPIQTVDASALQGRSKTGRFLGIISKAGW